MSDILFIKTSSLGDVIHHMPAVTEARRHKPDARIAWVVEENYAPLAALHPAVDEVIPVAVRRWRRRFFLWSSWRDAKNFIMQLRARTYDAIVDTQGLVRSAVLARIARGLRHGYGADSVRERLAAFAYNVQHSVPRSEHAIARNRALTGLALGYVPEGAPDFGLDRKALAGVARVPYGIFLHATAQKAKEWPEENWLALARALEGKTSLLLPFGSPTEKARADRLASQLNNTRVPIGRAIDDMARMIAGASFVVGVDTGILHLAAALGVPLVAIFCGSEPSLTGPMGSGHMEIVGGKGVTPSVEHVLAAVARVTA
jgi:heptosyltransferase-1